MFPAGKHAAVCQHCHFSFNYNELPYLKEHYAGLKPQAQEPIWHYAGLLILALVVLGSLIASGTNRKENQAYLAQPCVGDLYHVRTEEGNFSLLKVVAVGGNSVQLQANTYEIANDSQVSDLDAPENYDHEPFDLTQLDLQIMMQKEQIVDVERPDK
jgi:hypothetical protein